MPFWEMLGEASRFILIVPSGHFRIHFGVMLRLFSGNSGVPGGSVALSGHRALLGRLPSRPGAPPGPRRGASRPPPRRPLGLSWCPGGVRWAQHGVQEALKMDPRTAPVSRRWEISKMEPKWNPDGAQMGTRWSQLGITLHGKLSVRL